MRKQWILVGIVAGLLVTAPVSAQHTAPKQQPATAAAPSAPAGELADGKPLPAGTYTVRLTAQEAKPNAVGASENIERWVEFVQQGTVKGREVVSIVPQTEVKEVVKDAPPAANGYKLQPLKGGEYVRLWINRGGNHYLIHLPTGPAKA
jgi:hypothetical protein